MKKVLAVFFVLFLSGCGYYRVIDKADICARKLHVEDDFWEDVLIKDETGTIKVPPMAGTYRFWIKNNLKSSEYLGEFEGKYTGGMVVFSIGSGLAASGLLMSIAGMLGEEKLRPLLGVGLGCITAGVVIDFWGITIRNEALEPLKKSVEEYNRECGLK